MAKIIAGIVGGLILTILVGIILTAIGKFLLGVAIVIGFIMIAGLIAVAFAGKTVSDIWKTFN